jgi:Tol biopolymer transport system component
VNRSVSRQGYRLGLLAAAGLWIAGLLAQSSPSARAVVAAANGRIVFTSYRSGGGDIYVMNTDGSGVTQLTNDPAEDREPAWSPDGSRIAFVSYRGGSADIWVMKADGSGLTDLTTDLSFDDEPSWSPDGTKIAWRSNRALKDAEVFVMNADGSSPIQITSHPGVDDEPSWSPDGAKLAIRRCNPNDGSKTAGHCEIFVVNADGTNPIGIGAASPGAKDDPAWSPDGTKIAYRSYGVANAPDIWTMSATDGMARTNLSNDPDSNVDPAWSSDGTRLAYVRQPDNPPRCRKPCERVNVGNGEIWVMNADGTGQVNITNNLAFDGDPDWQSLSTGTTTATTATTTTSTTTTSTTTTSTTTTSTTTTSTTTITAPPPTTTTTTFRGPTRWGE